MSRNQRQHREAKSAPAETISDQIRPEAEETKERPKLSAVKPNDPSTGRALSVRDEHSSRKIAPRLKVVKNGSGRGKIHAAAAAQYVGGGGENGGPIDHHRGSTLLSQLSESSGAASRAASRPIFSAAKAAG